MVMIKMVTCSVDNPKTHLIWTNSGESSDAERIQTFCAGNT